MHDRNKALEADYLHRCETTSDINEHLPMLRALANEGWHVTEFGTRSGNSTIALLFGLADFNPHDYGEDKGPTLVSYDINPAGVVPPESLARWEFNQADTAKLNDIAPTDMLFIDTLHDCAQVCAELAHAHRVRRYLAFHDTVLFGWREESTNGLPGIMQAIFEFMATAEGQRWHVHSHAPNNNGLLVLKRHGK